MKTGFAWMRGGVALAALLGGLAAAQAGSLKIESWRNDDADIWNNTIIPAFNKHYPDIKVEFSATQPADYDAALNAKLDGGTAGDLITCRPFDRSLQLYQKHQLDGLNDLKGHGQFPRRRQGRLVDRRRQDDLLRSDGLGHPRLLLQRGRLQEDRRQAAKDDGRVPRDPRQAEEGRDLHADRHGHRRPVGGRDDGLPEHRPRLLEGRDRTRWR